MTTPNTHIADLTAALRDADEEWETAAEWGRHLAEVLPTGARLLVAGNGGSAAQAQHLTAEIVGRYARERRPLSAISLHADTSTITAIVNDFGADELFARQVQAHGRSGDVCLFMSTSGRSANLVRAAERARVVGLTVWTMTGPRPNPLTELADRAMCIRAASTATVQEIHLVALHLMCEHLDDSLDRAVELSQGGVR